MKLTPRPQYINLIVMQLGNRHRNHRLIANWFFTIIRSSYWSKLKEHNLSFNRLGKCTMFIIGNWYLSNLVLIRRESLMNRFRIRIAMVSWFTVLHYFASYLISSKRVNNWLLKQHDYEDICIKRKVLCRSRYTMLCDSLINQF